MQKKEEVLTEEELQAQLRRTKVPRDREVFGVVVQRVGGSRMRVRCLDGHERICRIPGRLKRNLWVREGNIVIVEPWEFNKDDKGDIIYKYTPTQIEFLKTKGHLKEIQETDEF